jgi:hypothetical protein
MTAAAHAPRKHDLTYWDFGLPMEGILSVLNDLAIDGWSVAHVSEDRGVFRGQTNATDSAVTKARYLLVRNRQPRRASS